MERNKPTQEATKSQPTSGLTEAQRNKIEPAGEGYRRRNGAERREESSHESEHVT